MSSKISTIIFILALLHTLSSALPANSDLLTSIKKVQQEHGKKVESVEKDAKSNEIEAESVMTDNETQPDTSYRQNKMLGFYGYYPPPYPTFAPIPAFYPTVPMEFYGTYPDFSGGNAVNYNSDYSDSEDDVMSRANTKKRPSTGTNHFKNSPIYYIRLPPTPYMLVPGLGYISNPPTIQPITPIMPTPLPINQFYNLPLNFVSNAKPTGIYQWGTPSTVPTMSSPGFGMPPNNYQTPQRPQRPYRPYQRPTPNNPYGQDSKVTNLKGQFLFNGRPEEIYLLPNLQNPYNSGYYTDPYSYNNFNQGYNSYY